MLRASRGAALLAALLTMLASSARAADAVAESMFQEALVMMREGNFAEACRRLEASKRREPMSGTVIVLGSCYEQTGRSASAWAEYREAEAMARAEGREEHREKAVELASALEPRLSKLRIDAEPEQGGATLTVELDGRAVPVGQLGVAFAIDPGEHAVSANAPGRKAWSQSVTIAADGDARVVAIPALESLPAEPAATAPPREPVAPPDERPEIPVWAWVSGAVGVALIAGATAFAVDQHAAADEIEEQCGGDRDRCPPTFDADGARAREERGFGLFVGLGIAGVLGLGAGVTGAVLALTAEDQNDAPAARLTPWPGGMSLSGRF
jgi:serine/threonine-protein kinase